MSILQRASYVFFLLLLLFLCILGTFDDAAISLNPSASNDHIEVQLLGSNDLHGQLNKYQTILGNKLGGAEYLAAYLKKYKQEHEHTLLVHAGDMVGGSPPISSLFQDEPTIEYLNLLNFDIGTPGNHEFDEGIDEMKRLIHGGYHKKTGYFPGSNTPYISANVIDKKTGTLLLPPYVIKQINGVKIGFIGVVTTETTDFLLPEYRKEIEIIDEVTAINQTVQLLKEKGIKSIVVLAHISAKSSWSGTNASEDLAKMAPKIDDEVDIIFGGHNHQYANTVVDHKLIVQSYSYGTAFSQVELTIDLDTQDVVNKKATIIPTWHHKIQPDQDTLTFLRKYKENMDVYVHKVVGEVPKEIKKKKNALGESPLAKMVAESGQAAMNTEMAFFHHGGIRASLSKGTITMEDLYTALPFDHHFVKITLTGEQIKQVLEQQWTQDKENKLQTVGLTYSWKKSAPVGSRILSLKDVHNQDIRPQKKYTIAVSNYIASGGDGFTAFKQGKLLETGPSAVDALAIYLASQ